MTDVKMKVKDLDALEEAALLCGLTLRRDQKTHAWYGRFMGDTTPAPGRKPEEYGRCEHALRLQDHRAGDYEIGVVRALDGEGYELMMDTWGPGARLEQAAGRGVSKLRQEYAVAVTGRRVKKTLARQGFTVTREQLAGGAVRLRLRAR